MIVDPSTFTEGADVFIPDDLLEAEHRALRLRISLAGFRLAYVDSDDRGSTYTLERIPEDADLNGGAL